MMGLDSVYICTYDSVVPDEVPEWIWNIEKTRGNLQKHRVAFRGSGHGAGGSSRTDDSGQNA